MNNPTIIAALVTAVFSLAIALISLFGNRATERKKLRDLLKNQEFQNRITALHLAIEMIQKIKDELRFVIDFLERNKKHDTIESAQILNDATKAFLNIYSSKLSSLHDEEATILHELHTPLLEIRHLMDKIDNKKYGVEQDNSILIKQFAAIREQLSYFQSEYRNLRNQIIDDE